MTEMVEGSRAQCCAAGIDSMDDDLIRGACIIEDEPVKQLEYTDLAECIEREVTNFRFEDPRTGEPVEGYESYTDANSMTVHPNNCCLQACAEEEMMKAQFLKACASSEPSGMETFTNPMIGDKESPSGEIIEGVCMVDKNVGTTYLLSADPESGTAEGTEACTLDTKTSLSTQFPDDGVTNLHCCAAAVADESIVNENYCQIDYEYGEPFDVQYDANADQCFQTEGSSTKLYLDQDGVEVFRDDPVIVEIGDDPVLVEDSVCCIAYDENDTSGPNIELSFACPEIDEMETTYAIVDMQCVRNDTTWMWADYDLDMMYDDNEPIFNRNTELTEDMDGSVCCVEDENLPLEVLDEFTTLSDTCNKVEKEEDEYFTYDAPTCTKRSDKITCYLSGPADGEQTEIRREEEHCVEEILDPSACCEAKQAGKAGVGLEDACAEVTITGPSSEEGGSIIDDAIDAAEGVIDDASEEAGAVIDDASEEAGAVIDDASEEAGAVIDDASEEAGGVINDLTEGAESTIEDQPSVF